MSPSSCTHVAAALDTPCVLVDRVRLDANLQAMQARATWHGLALRPHIKTHKCPEIAARQLALGAAGITAAKVDEALVFLAAGVRDLTLAYPLVCSEKLDRLLAAAKAAGARVRLLADSESGVATLEAAARRHGPWPDVSGGGLEVFLKIDVGLGRCGLVPDDPGLIPLARRLADGNKEKGSGLRLAGLLSHAGQAYGAADAAQARDVAEAERRLMVGLAGRLRGLGLAVPEVSVGSTPTVLAAEDFSGLTEIRPGNYAFLDRAAVRLGLAGLGDVALTVLATVVSRGRDRIIIDAGSKSLSAELGAHGTGSAGYGFGLAFPVQTAPTAPCAADACSGGAGDEALAVADLLRSWPPGVPGLPVARLSEEHGILNVPGPGTAERPAATWAAGLAVGDRVRILPNHACAVANLAERYVVLLPGPPPGIVFWEVAARGKVR